MDRYTARINARGTTQKERYVNRIRDNINRKAFENPSYKDVKINGEKINLVIDDGTSNSNKKFSSIPGYIVKLGDYIEWNNQIYLVNSLNPDAEIYSAGSMVLCTTLLRWQKSNGIIVERWAYAEDFTKYDSGEISNGNITIASNQYGMTVPIDNETKYLTRRSRFVIDVLDGADYEKGFVPDVYRLTNRKTVINNNGYFNRGGVMTLTMAFDSFDASIDKYMDLGNGTYGWICGQKSENVTKPDPTTNIIYSINGEDSIYAEFKRVWTAEFTDENNSPITADNWSWNVVQNFNITTSTNISSEFSVAELGNNQIQITAGNDYIGETFTIQIVSDGKVVAEKNVLVKGVI